MKDKKKKKKEQELKYQQKLTAIPAIKIKISLRDWNQSCKYPAEQTSIILNRVRFENLQDFFKYLISIKRESVNNRIFKIL